MIVYIVATGYFAVSVYCMSEAPPYLEVTAKEQEYIREGYEYLGGLYCRTHCRTYCTEDFLLGVYREENSQMYLRLFSNGYWSFTKTLGISDTGEAEKLNRTEENITLDFNSIQFVEWHSTKTKAVWNSTDYEKRCKKNVEDSEDGKNGNTSNDDDTKKIIIISLSVAFVLLLGIFLIFIFLRKKKVKEEEPEMEKNEVYGEEDEYYDEHDNRELVIYQAMV